MARTARLALAVERATPLDTEKGAAPDLERLDGVECCAILAAEASSGYSMAACAKNK